MKPNGTENTRRGKWAAQGEYDKYFTRGRRVQNNRSVSKDELRRELRSRGRSDKSGGPKEG